MTALKYRVPGLHTVVLREHDLDRPQPNEEQWLRDVHFYDDKHYLILCCAFDQAIAFFDAQYIQMDLAFKMVAGDTKVFSIAGWSDISLLELRTLTLPGVITYARICPHELRTRMAYATLSFRLFKMLEDVGCKPVRFRHIHKTGIRTVTGYVQETSTRYIGPRGLPDNG